VKPGFLDYLELCKPRVVALMLITAIIAMLLASPSEAIPWLKIVLGTLAIGFASAAGGVINHLIDRRIDALMQRTRHRPIAAGRVKPTNALLMALLLCAASLFIFVAFLNVTALLLTFASLFGYAGLYTGYLKRATPQNIVIGGLAGAMPPLLGWSVITGRIDAPALLLVMIIFLWTPPHFWALSIGRIEEYAKAEIPMLPVTHGLEFTRLNVLLYTILMVASTYLPIAIGMAAWIYAISATILNLIFLYYAIMLYINKNSRYALHTFSYSIVYLALLFTALLADHFI